MSSPTTCGLCEQISILSPLERTVGRIERVCPPRIIYSARPGDTSLSSFSLIREDAFASLSSPLSKSTRRCLVSSKSEMGGSETRAGVLFLKGYLREFFSSEVCPSRRLLASLSSPYRIQAHAYNIQTSHDFASLVFS